MATRVSSRKQADEINRSFSNRTSYSFVNLKPSEQTPEITVTLRLIGDPIAYREHTAYLPSEGTYIDKEGKEKIGIKWNKAEFPDQNEVGKKYYRVCSEGKPEFEPCVWCEEKFKVATKYAMTVLEKQADGTFVPKILCDTGYLFEKIFEEEKKNEVHNADPENEDLQYAEKLGGVEAPLIKFTVKLAPKKVPPKEFSVSPNNPKKSKLTEEQIEILRQSYEPTAAELEEIYVSDPELKNLPVWYNYGFNLTKFYTYRGLTAAKKEEHTTSPDDLVPTSHANDEDHAPIPAPARAKATTAEVKVKTPVKPEPVAEEKNIFVEPDGEDTETEEVSKEDIDW